MVSRHFRSPFPNRYIATSNIPEHLCGAEIFANGTLKVHTWDQIKFSQNSERWASVEDISDFTRYVSMDPPDFILDPKER